MRQTKIVATLGPASSSPESIGQLLNAGVDTFRLNFSHDTRESHRALIKLIRSVSATQNMQVAILQDLGGPKIRTGLMQDGVVTLTVGTKTTITTDDVEGTAKRFSTLYADLPNDVSPGACILLDDGSLELQVTAVIGNNVDCRVIRGGLLHNHKGINLPGSQVSAPAVTKKDMADLEVGIEEEVDFVALSFVRSPADILQVRRLLAERKSPIQVIAKIERPEAVEQIESITEAAHGILVARGDLGVEMDLARVPLLQKEIIRISEAQEKYVIVATQMLESMVHNQRPTRAEVSDVTNAILDGADAVMLSAETSVGAYPVESVRVMDRIARLAEEFDSRQTTPTQRWGAINAANPVQDAIGRAAYVLCHDLGAKVIVAFSATGGTALFLSKRRPAAPILVFTAREDTCRRMRLFRGVYPVLDSTVTNKEAMMSRARTYVREHELASPGDPLLMVAGTEFGQIASTNGIETFKC